MTKKKTRRNEPRRQRGDRSEQPTEESNDSVPNFDPNFEPNASTAIELLRAWNLKPLSVLAMLADNGGALSGSGSLEMFCGNSTGTSSDLDIYLPAVRGAALDAIHVLTASGVRWKNFLSDRIEDALQYGTTMIPFWTIYETVDILNEQNYTIPQLGEYLGKSLTEGASADLKFVEDFVAQFCEACGEVNDHSTRIDYPDDTVWVFGAGGGSQFSVVPLAVSKAIYQIVDTLDSLYNNRPILSGRCQNERERLIRKPGGLGGAELKTSWKKEGYHYGLLQKYINGRVMKERRQYSRADVSVLISAFLYPEKTGSVSAGDLNKTYNSRFRILNGTLPDGKNLQLILVPTREGGVLHTMLHFYSTHVMSFVSGTMAAHLYYSTAKRHRGTTWNFEKDPRQAGAKKAIRKYEERGWVFQQAEKATVKARYAGDEHVKFISLESCYTSALREKNANMTLPRWWQTYFEEREIGFRGYSWWEDCGKINKIHKKRGPWGSYRLLEWVHDALAGHEDVISISKWRPRDDKRSALDLWFGGVKIALPRSYNRLI